MINKQTRQIKQGGKPSNNTNNMKRFNPQHSNSLYLIIL
ncbi:hypothetical protein SPONL_17 [uncultured Candidatus Thioglobus sp.]|nr:hypothetical protein SPONL_17 [uncultured Candidatus Thioglobus sp.]